MRNAAGFLLLATLLISPVFAHAESSACDPKKEKNCRGSTDACLSENISRRDGKVVFTPSKPRTYNLCVESQCTYAKEKAQQCWCGRETFEIAPGKMSKLDISRCDPNLSKLVSSAVGSTAADVSNLFSERDAAKLVAQNIPVNDTATLSAVLRGVGIEGATEDIVRQNPQAAYDLLQGIASGDESAAQKAADRLGLNADLSDAKTLQGKLGQALQDNISPEKLFATPYTFSQVPDAMSEIERAKCAIAKIESGSCGGNYGTIGPWTRRGNRAFGKYQVMDFNVPSWSSRSCGYALTPYAFLNDPACQEKVFENVYGGYVSSCGSYEGAASKWFSNSCTVRSGGDGWLSIPGYVRKFAAVFGSPLPSSIVSTYAPAGFAGSPFSNVTPYEDASYGGYGVSPFSIASGYAPPAGYAPAGYGHPAPLPPAPPPPLAGASTDTASPAPNPPAAPQAVATIVVQPKSVVRGNPITVSWTSVGMNAAGSCEVRLGGSVIAQGSGGSKIVPTGPATPVGTMTFTLKCIALSGQQVEQSASTTIN